MIKSRLPQIPVVYERESTNKYWQRQQKRAKKYINYPTLPQDTFIKAAEQLANMASIEREKENALLQKYFPSIYEDNTLTLIEKYNIVFQGEEQTKRINARIKEFLKKASENTKAYDSYVKKYGNDNGFQGHKKFTGLAPTLWTFYTFYLKKQFPQMLENFGASLTANDLNNLDTLQAKFDIYLLEAITEAIRVMTEDIKPSIYADVGELRPVLDILRSDPRIQDIFIESTKDILGANNIVSLLEDIISFNTNLKSPNIDYIVDKNFGKIFQKSQGPRAGGKFTEAIAPAIAKATINYLAQNSKSNATFSIAHAGGPNVETDFSFIIAQGTIAQPDLDNIHDQILNEMSHKESSSTMEKLWKSFSEIDKKLDELDDAYAVFVNAKNKSIGADARVAEKTYDRPMSALPDFLEGLGYNHFNETDFLRFVYNIGEGAVSRNQQDRFIGEYSYALKVMAAKIMFDDYLDIGTKSGNMAHIHLYYLSGKYIPASEVFQIMADAAKEDNNLNRWTFAKITPPDPITDYGILGDGSITQNWIEGLNIDLTGMKGKTRDAAFKAALYEHWNTEAENAAKTSRWKLTFKLRIKDLLQQSLIS